MNSIKSNTILLVFSITLFSGSYFIEQESSAHTILLSVALTILGSSLFNLLFSFLNNEKNIRKYFFSLSFFRAQEIRFSMSYLYRIKVDDKYLLVKGNRIDQYQPVGGVYKRLPQSDSFFNELKILDDNKILLTDSDRNDLRVRIKRKYLFQFLKWFEDQKEREIDHWREFSEELIQSEIISHVNFPYINFSVKERVKSSLKYSEHFQCYEILWYDVLELIPNEIQRQELRNLQNSQSDKYVWVDSDQIESLGYDKIKENSIRIGEHSKYII